MTPRESADVVQLLMAAYPTQRLRMGARDAEAMTLAYMTGIEALEAAQARAAVSALVLTEQWIPTIAQIVAKATEHRDGRKREGAEAWGDVLQAIRRWGYARSPGVDFEFSDPVVARCVKALVWGDLCSSENPIADRAKFVELYKRLADQDATDRAIGSALPTATGAKSLPGGTYRVATAAPTLPAGARSSASSSRELRSAGEAMKQLASDGEHATLSDWLTVTGRTA